MRNQRCLAMWIDGENCRLSPRLGSPLIPYSSEEAARSALLDEDIEAYFVIPADYVETGLVQEYSTSESSIFNANAESAVLKILLVQALVEGHVPESVADRLQSPLRIERARLTAEGDAALKERDTFSRFLVPYIFGLMLLMSIFMTSGLLVQAIAEEKQSAPSRFSCPRSLPLP